MASAQTIYLHSIVDRGTIKDEGLKALIADAKRLGAQAKDLRTLFRKVGRPMLARARANCPIGRAKSPTRGRLKKSIKLQASPDGVRLYSYIPLDEKGQGQYSGYVHWGRDGLTGPKFMKNAMDDHLPQAYQDFEDGITAIMKNGGWL